MNPASSRRDPSQRRRSRHAFLPACERVEPRVLLTGQKVAYVVSGLGGGVFPDQVVAHLVTQGFNVHEAAWNDPNPTQDGPGGDPNPADAHGDPGQFTIQQDTSSFPATATFTVDLGSPNTPDKVDPKYHTDFVDSVVNDLETNYGQGDTVVLIGYSLGGNSALLVANRLAQDAAAGKTNVKVSLLALLDPVGFAPNDAANPNGIVAGLESGSYIINGLAPNVRSALQDPFNSLFFSFKTQFTNGTNGLGSGTGPVNDDNTVPGFRGNLPGLLQPGGASQSPVVQYLYNRYQSKVPFPLDLQANATIGGTPRRSLVTDRITLNGVPIQDQALSASTTPHPSTDLDVLYGVVPVSSNLSDILNAINNPVTVSAHEDADFPADPTVQNEVSTIIDAITPPAPIAVASLGVPTPIKEGGTVTLDGRQSTFSLIPGESGQLQYHWAQTRGPTIAGNLDGTSATTPTFTFQAPAGGDYSFTLTVTDPLGQTASTTLGFTAQVVASQLVVTAQPPASVVTGGPFSLTVSAEDASGAVDTSFSGPVGVALGAHPAGGTLGGPLSAMASGGMASFSGLTLNPPGSGYTLLVSGAGLAGATTGAITVTPAQASQIMVISQPPVSIAAGSGFGLTVAAEDGSGHVVTSFNGPVNVILAGNPAGGTLGGPLSAMASGGMASFSGLTLNPPGSGYTLLVSGAGLAGATTGAITVTPGPATHLVVTSPPPLSVLAGSPFNLTVAAEDALNNVATSFGGALSVTLAGSPTPLLSLPAQGGVATFNGLTVGHPGTYSLQVTGGGLAGSQALTLQVNSSNHPPVLAPLSDQVVSVGKTLSLNASASDPDPGQSLSYSLDPGATAGAAIDPGTGVFTWTPATASSATFTVRVTDNGEPRLGDARSFTVNATAPAPQVTQIAPVALSRKGLGGFIVTFDEALNQASATNPAQYLVLGAVTKRRRTSYSKPLGIRGITYDGNAHAMTIILARPAKGGVQVTVHGGITAANGATSSGDVTRIVP